MSSSQPRRTPGIDPRAIPIIGTDSHLPAVPQERLTIEALRRQLLDAHDRAATLPGDGTARGDIYADREPAAASVLIPLVQRPDSLHVLLTRRSDQMRNHAGQISFPGGRAEPTDADAVATALREAQEEVGIDPARVDIIGRLPVYTTVTKFIVTPIVGLLPPDYQLKLDAIEVAEAFEVPLPFLMDPANHHRHLLQPQGADGDRGRTFLSMPYLRPDAPTGTHSYFIWGATAAMLRNLYHLLM